MVDTNHFFNQKSISDWKVKTIINSFFRIERNLQNHNLYKQIVSIGPNQILYKQFNVDLEHEYLKIEGTFHYLSNLWTGQIAYIKVDS